MSCSWLWLIVNLFFILISFSQSRYIRLPSVNCSELSPIGTPITQLINVLPSSNWGFAFLTRTTVATYFLLDDLKGTITVKRPLDREDLCRLNLCSCSNECLIKLEINAVSDIYTHIINIPIRILDENDNYCYFSNDFYHLNISESVRLNTRIILPIAHDPDQPPNNVESYSLISNNYTEFRLDHHLTPSMIVIQSLDRELRDKYYFKFCANEGIHNHKRTCCTNITLTITDVNDNSPKFQHDQQSSLIVNVSELISIHSELIQLKAFDPDEGLNGQIRYTFSKWTLNDVTIDKIFYLDPINGSIILLKQLDYEQRNSYELQVEAKDLGPNAIPTYITVMIKVIDENDFTPEIFSFTPADVQLINNSVIYISENLPLNVPILYLTVSDNDNGDNGRISMELFIENNQTSFIKLEKLTDNTYVLKSNTEFDRELISSYLFTLITYDHGQVKHSVKHQYELHLIDINDCSPIFEYETNYTFYVNENNEEKYLLHQIKTIDLDENDHVTIALLFDNDETNKNLFEINKNNELIILKSLDYEEKNSYEFYIQAQDSFGHRTKIPIFIFVNNLNDNPVRFNKSFLQFSIEENQEKYRLINHIYAYDKDNLSKIVYRIHSDDYYYIKDYIYLNSNGSLYTKRSFDREKLKTIHFRIIANDSFYTDIVSIQLNILDQNDNKPMLTTLSPYCYIYNRTNHNYNIEIKLEGYDPDDRDNGNITFSLRKSSSNDIILLSNGVLILKPILNKYLMDIHLKDNGQKEILSTIYENFIVLVVDNAYDCENYSIFSSIKFDQRTFIFLLSIILTSLICLTLVILIIICCFYNRQRKRAMKLINNNSNNNKQIENLTPSFSSTLIDDAENDTLLLSSPSPQFTALTTISISTTTTNDSTRLTTFTDRIQTNKSSSLSSSSSSTYVKMSRSFDDEIL